MKQCSICKETKDANLFYGRLKWCAECHKARTKADQNKRAGNPDWLEYSRLRYQKHRHKYLARARVRLAVNSGRLLKPKQCTACSTETPLQAHHEDYNKPLQVVWLCDYCHKLTHGRIKFTKETA